MSEELSIIQGSKEEQYQSLIPQIKALIGDEKDRIANLANFTAALKEAFQFFWVGFYFVQKEELVLGPFQGLIACTRIQKGKGVCGTSWEKNEVLIVDDVERFPGHIACSSITKSEVVVPLVKDGEVIAVLDVDSEELATFDAIDKQYLKELCDWLVTII
ncbi:MAG TPA: GAF domain-containing protein [Crocinitomicaceae bacterium]|nr:GAF domain-containing protein [Crocinitomicaceae bacterium]